MKKANCPACNALKNGIKSRKSFEHNCGKLDYYPGISYQRLFNQINESGLNPTISQMTDIIYVVKEDFILKTEGKPLSTVTEADAKEIIKAGYPQFFITGNWHLSDESEGVKEPCKKLYGRTKAFNFWFFDDKMDIDDTDDEKILTLDDVNYDVKLQCYIKAHQLGYDVKPLQELGR